MRDDLDGVLKVVEDEEGVYEHEQGFGQPLRIGHVDGDARLEVADGVVSEEADCAAGEARQSAAWLGRLRVGEAVA